MLPTRCVQAVLAVAVALTALALVLEERALLAGAGVIILFVVWRGLLFHREFARLLGAVTVLRTVDSPLARQGSEMPVSTRVEWRRSLPFACRVEDLVPAGAVVEGGDAGADVPAGTPGGVTLRYRMRVLSHGEIPFRGIALAARDPFFRNGITLARAAFLRPELSIHPAGTFEGEGGGPGFGEREVDELRGISSLTVRSFREFKPGDSLKTVDWKLSAKFSKLFVREYAGLRGEPPALIIDLPDRSAIADLPGFEQLLGSLQAAVEKAVRFYETSTLVIISGPNLIEFLPLKRDMYRWFSVQKQLQPADRKVHAFRASGEREITAKLRAYRSLAVDQALGSGDGSARAFADRLEEIRAAFSGGRAQTIFERQMRSLLPELRISDLYIFSLCAGDTSHIRGVTEIARMNGMRVHAVVPHIARSGFLEYTLRRSGVDDVVEAA